MSWCKNVMIAIDQLANAVLCGWADETFSARCYRLGRKSTAWYVMQWLIDHTVFCWQKDEAGRRHCEQCYWYEQERKDMPIEYRRKGKK